MTTRLAVVIASAGRADDLAASLAALAGQCTRPDQVVLSLSSPKDAPEAAVSRFAATVVTGPRGLPKQRNRGLDALDEDVDLVAFFDDDYLPAPGAIAGIVDFFATHPKVVGAEGQLLADGIKGPGISLTEAQAHLKSHALAPTEPVTALPRRSLYGCNMVYRVAALAGLRFDENLPLYGWQEDVDFSVRVGQRGRLVWTNAFTGIHRGVKRGRSPGVPLGYSQIANPYYLVRKGTMPLWFALQLVARNLLANHLLSLHPEPWVDRLGRVRGNWLALRDLAAGTSDPKKVLELL